jgi:hypothetical protein
MYVVEDFIFSLDILKTSIQAVNVAATASKQADAKQLVLYLYDI